VRLGALAAAQSIKKTTGSFYWNGARL